MLEDFWLPRREGGKGTEITTLPAGQNLGELEDVKYFQKKLLQSLNVPYSRLEPQQGGMIGLGRVSEVTRDEVKFSKFVARLRNKFCQIFDEALRIQLLLKGICTIEEWERIKDEITYDFKRDNDYIEMRDAEVLRERLNLAISVDPFVGKYYSADWVKKNILRQTEDEIETMSEQMDQEQQGPMLAPPPEMPPQDNGQDNSGMESQTPQLDNEVDKYGTK